MKSLIELYEAFARFQKSAYALDKNDHYELGLWFEGDGTLYDVTRHVVTQWETWQEGIDKLNGLAGLNEEAARHG
jgi:hypothetical protein